MQAQGYIQVLAPVRLTRGQNQKSIHLSYKKINNKTLTPKLNTETCKYFRGFYFIVTTQKNNQKVKKDDKKC